MKYAIAFLLPPLGLLLAGYPFQAIISTVICIASVPLAFAGVGFVTWIAAIIHAMTTIGAGRAKKKEERMLKAVKQGKAEG